MMFRKEKKKFYCKTEDKFTKKQMQRILAGLINFHKLSKSTRPCFKMHIFF